jgi:hypothetical protein
LPLIFIGVAPSDAEKRVALVVSNCDYEHADILADPVTDSRHMGEALQRLGVVMVCGETVGLQEAPARLGRLSKFPHCEMTRLALSRPGATGAVWSLSGSKPASVRKLKNNSPAPLS